MSNTKQKKSQNKPGRPKHADTPTVLSLRVPASLVRRIEELAAKRGVSRNRAGGDLLRLGLSTLDAGR